MDFGQALKKLETELRIRGFSQKTIDAYGLQTRLFLEYAKKDVDMVEEDDVKQYMSHLMAEKHQKPSSVALALSSLKFFFTHIIKNPAITLEIKSPKQEKRIPTVLTREEVPRLLNAIENKKHRLIIELMLSSGLRVAEAVSLKKQDVDNESKLIHVKSGKGKKDRTTIISSSTLKNMQDYLAEAANDSDYLFQGQDGHVTVKLAQKIIKKAMQDAGMKKNIYCHALRSTFATLLLENGVDTRKIQMLLGHSSIATTERYVHVSATELKKIKSPLDDL